jgi:xanthine dehydrogenase YagS FAD-binding subunit
MIKNFAYAKADTTAAAVKALSTKGAVIHAGGTDLLGCLRENIISADRVVSISGIKELKGITVRPDGGLTLGALTTIAEVAAHAAVNGKYAALAQAAAEVASPQLRNQGTIGGNLCQRPRCWYFRGDFPCIRKSGTVCYALEGENQNHAIFNSSACSYVHPSDTAVALTALQAQLIVIGGYGRRAVRIENFFADPAKEVTRETVLFPTEILAEVQLPPVKGNVRSSYRKIRARQAWDFALVSVAVALEFSNDIISTARIVLGGVAARPWRVEAAEKLLAGKRIDAATAAAAAQAAVAGATPLRDNGYKIKMAQGAVEESILALA